MVSIHVDEYANFGWYHLYDGFHCTGARCKIVTLLRLIRHIFCGSTLINIFRLSSQISSRVFSGLHSVELVLVVLGKVVSIS